LFSAQGAFLFAIYTGTDNVCLGEYHVCKGVGVYSVNWSIELFDIPILLQYNFLKFTS